MAAVKLLRPFQPFVGAAKNAPSGASGLLALLEEPDRTLQEHALKKLNVLIDTNWAEASELVTHIESLAEDDAFPARELAAAVASKCYYHLEEYGEALRLALGAGHHFDVNAKTEYVETIVARCIDEYTSLRLRALSTNADERASAVMDPRLEAIVNRMFARCWQEGAWRQALGVALEARRLDVVEETLRRAVAAGVTVPPPSETGAKAGSSVVNVDFLAYTYDVANGLVTSRDFRQEVLKVLVRLYAEAPESIGQAAVAAAAGGRDYLSLCRCLQALDDAAGVGSILVSLLRRGCGLADAAGGAAGHAGDASAFANSEAVLLAYQVAFDIVDSENQEFSVKVYQSLPAPREAQDENDEPSDAGGSFSAAASGAGAGQDGATVSVDAEGGAGAGSAAAAVPRPPLSPDSAFDSAIRRIRSILDGSVTSALYLDFLSRNNKCDQLLLKTIKNGVDARNSVLHHSILVSHGFMNCGTTSDVFLRNNVEWMGKAANWARFSAVASQGVVHKGHLGNAMQVLSSYLPASPGAPSTSNYSEGGALYALGLIHANRGTSASAGINAQPGAVQAGAEGAGAGAASPPASDAGGASGGVVEYLSNALTLTQDEVIQHGACLGIGLAAMATGTDALYGSIREVMFQDKAVAGEAAGIALGLLLLGKGPAWASGATGEPVVTELLGQARDTQHEKIIRGIALGLALLVYGLEEGADPLISEMSKDKDAVLRYGAMHAIGLAYAGTANNTALRQLLHVAVSDVSDDVRRAAVINIGFLLCRQPNEVPTLVSQLAESYNAHVRYGAAMALGIACAGTGLPEAISILEPMLEDNSDFVRQGALIALGLVLQQESEAHLPRAKVIRDKMMAVVTDKHQSTMTKMGAILGLGIVDAAGRNGVVSLISRSGFQKTSSIVGMTLFTQYWYWFPLLHFLSLACQPTAMVGMQGELKIPASFASTCACPPSWFAYQPAMVEKKEDRKAQVTTVELSTAAKARAKAKHKAKGTTASGGDKMDVDSGSSNAAGAGSGSSAAASSGAAAGVSESKGDDVSMDIEAVAAADTKESKEKDGASKDTDSKDTASAAKKEKEPESYRLSNPCRVTLNQQKFVTFSTAALAAAADAPTAAAAAAAGAAAAAPAAPASSAETTAAGASSSASSSTAAAPSSTAGAAAAPSTFDLAAATRYVPIRKDATRHTGVLMLRDTAWGTPDARLGEIQAPTAGGEEGGPEPKAPKAFEWTIGEYY